jgi:integrase
MADTVGFTEARVKAIALPEQGRVEYRDADVPELVLRVGKTAKTWTVVARVKGGRLERVTLGRFPKVSVVDARAKAKAILGEQAEGKSRRDRERAARERFTFGEIADAYFADRTAEGKRSVAALRQAFQLYLGALPDDPPKPRGRKRVKPEGAVNWQRRKSSEVDPDDVRTLKSKLAASCGTYTANRTLQLLRAIVNFGRRKGMIGRDHAGALVDAVELFPEQSRERRLNDQEVADFMAALKSETDEGFRDLVALALFTGARRSNIMSMRWAEVDVDARVWTIPSAKAKAGRAIDVPLGDAAVDILRRRRQSTPADADFVFPAASASGHVESPKKRWAAFRERAGLNDVRMHDIRRTLGSYMVDQGAPLEVIAKQLGHRDRKSTEVYARIALKPVRDAQASAEAAILAAAAKPRQTGNVVRLPRKGRK